MRIKSKRSVEYLMHHPGQFMELDTTSRVRRNTEISKWATLFMVHKGLWIF